METLVISELIKELGWLNALLIIILTSPLVIWWFSRKDAKHQIERGDKLLSAQMTIAQNQTSILERLTSQANATTMQITTIAHDLGTIKTQIESAVTTINATTNQNGDKVIASVTGLITTVSNNMASLKSTVDYVQSHIQARADADNILLRGLKNMQTTIADLEAVIQNSVQKMLERGQNETNSTPVVNPVFAHDGD